METLAQIAVWVLLIVGLIMIIVPIIFGLATKNLALTVHSVEDGKLWFYRHGLGIIIGIIAISAAGFVMAVIKILP